MQNVTGQRGRTSHPGHESEFQHNLQWQCRKGPGRLLLLTSVCNFPLSFLEDVFKFYYLFKYLTFSVSHKQRIWKGKVLWDLERPLYLWTFFSVRDVTLTSLHLICFKIIKKAIVRRPSKDFSIKLKTTLLGCPYALVCLCGTRGQSVQYNAVNSAFTCGKSFVQQWSAEWLIFLWSITSSTTKTVYNNVFYSCFMAEAPGLFAGKSHLNKIPSFPSRCAIPGVWFS